MFRITVNKNPLKVEFEVDALEEAARIILDGKNVLARIFADAKDLADHAESSEGGSEEGRDHLPHRPTV